MNENTLEGTLDKHLDGLSKRFKILLGTNDSTQ